MDAPLLLLLFALASQVAAQSSAAVDDRTVEGDDDCDCGAEFTEEPKPDCPPRYESVVNDGPLSKDVVLSGARPLVGDGNCGNSIGGAAIVEPILVQPLLD